MALPVGSQRLINLINAVDAVWAAGDRRVLWSTDSPGDSPGVPEREDLSVCPPGTQGALSWWFCVRCPAMFSGSGSHKSQCL